MAVPLPKAKQHLNNNRVISKNLKDTKLGSLIHLHQMKKIALVELSMKEVTKKNKNRKLKQWPLNTEGNLEENVNIIFLYHQE
jgi:hypothetical protein